MDENKIIEVDIETLYRVTPKDGRNFEMTEIKTTPEQLAFIETFCSGTPCFLSARAGTGKTTTIRPIRRTSHAPSGQELRYPPFTLSDCRHSETSSHLWR